MNFRSIVPNTLTAGNLICGVLAILFAAKGQLQLAAWLILAGAFLDLFDGLSARLLKVDGALGKQLDSLADVVTFGVAPAFIALSLNGVFAPESTFRAIDYVPVVFPAFAAFRLAKFNIDTRQSDSFLGLPTPAAGLFWVSVPLGIHDRLDPGFGENAIHLFASSPLAIAVATLVIGVLMISEIPLMSLKFKTYAFSKNIRRYTLIALSALSFAFLGFASIPIILLLYILLSLSSRNHVIQS